MLSVQHVSKRYGAVRALSDVSIEFSAGEIHAVLGENGAGKSTLMGVLAGFVVPDAGSVKMEGREFPVGRPSEARRVGVSMVHQHFTLVPAFTVAENLALSQTTSLAATLDPMRDAARPIQLAKDLGWAIDPSARVDTLPVGVQQRVEVLKSLAADSRILIFDEPTAVLSPDEVEDLFRVIRSLRDAGKAIVLIAHKLSEVLAIADRVTVLRGGRWVASAARDDVDASILAEWMVGGRVESTTPHRHPETDVQPRLKVSGLSVRGDRGEAAIRDVSFQVPVGETYGIGGVDGNGQVELAEALVGVRSAEAGSIDLVGGGKVAYIPQDRQGDGLAMELSIRDNLLIEGHRRADLRLGPFLRPKAVDRWVADLVARFEIKTSSVRNPASSLSGGNQQKVVVARNLDLSPDLLVAANPTRGLDIRATDFVHSQVRRTTDGNSAVVVISTDTDELEALAERTVYLSRGRLASSIGGDA